MHRITADRIKNDPRVHDFDRDSRGMWWIDLADGYIGPGGAHVEMFDTVAEAARFLRGVRKRSS